MIHGEPSGSFQMPEPSPSAPPGVMFSTGIGAPVQLQSNNYRTCSAAPDGTVWVINLTDEGYQLLLYDFSLNTLQTTYVTQSGTIEQVSAVSFEQAAFICNDDSGTWIGYTDGLGNLTQLPVLPGGATPAQLAAAPDGSLWVLDSEGNSYAYSSDQSAFAPNGQGYGLTSLSVGNAKCAVALAGQTPYQFGDNGWEALDVPQGWTSLDWLGACVDDTLWYLSGSTLAGYNPATIGVQKIDVTTIVDNPDLIINWTVGTPTTVFCFCGTFTGWNPALVPCAIGVLDLPAKGWPAMTADQQNAYSYISVQLQQEQTQTGVRGAYTNLLAPIGDWNTDLSDMTPDPNVTAADWAIVKAQLQLEFTYVDSVRNLFDQLTTVSGFYGTMQTDQFTGVSATLGLSAPNQGSTTIDLMFENMGITLLQRIGSIVPPPYGLFVSIIGSGIATAIQQTIKQNSPNAPDGTLQIAYQKMADALAQNLVDLSDAQGDEQIAIVTDWGKLQACGQAVAQGIWTWPPTLAASILDGLEPTFELYLYQALMGAAWQIVRAEVATTPYQNPPSPNAPGYDAMCQYLIGEDYSTLSWWYICCKLGSETSFSNNGPFPASSTMETIMALPGVQPSDFFSGANGWSNIPAQEADGWSPPVAEASWGAYPS